MCLHSESYLEGGMNASKASREANNRIPSCIVRKKLDLMHVNLVCVCMCVCVFVTVESSLKTVARAQFFYSH